MRNPIQWPEETHDLSEQEIAFGAKQDELGERCQRSNGFCRRICAKLTFVLIDSKWLLSCLLAVAFLGYWLPNKRRSEWALTFIPVFHLLLGLGAHFYFILSSRQRSFHMGSKRLRVVRYGSLLLQISIARMDERFEQKSTPTHQCCFVHWCTSSVVGFIRRCVLSSNL